jgi:lipoprotein-anchoring transpeptidase ErfK/SrfK
MAMVRNESLGRMVMWLCFGTAFLSLAVHWYMTNTTEPLNSAFSMNSRKKAIAANTSLDNGSVTNYRYTAPVTFGETAFGASVPATVNQPDEQVERQPSNLIQTQDAPKNTRFVVSAQESPQNQGNLPQSILAPLMGQSKSSATGSNQSQLLVDLSDRRVYVYRQEEVIASYPIAIGKPGWDTPVGEFKVMHMEHDPIWKHPITGKVFEPGTDSPLGERWIGFWSDGKNALGFHGTPSSEIDLIGTAVSHGCLRMRNADVRMLYDQVGLGTTVVVRP